VQKGDARASLSVSAPKKFQISNRRQPLSEVRRKAIFLSVSFKKILEFRKFAKIDNADRAKRSDCRSDARIVIADPH
jgi:hypothetical protein